MRLRLNRNLECAVYKNRYFSVQDLELLPLVIYFFTYGPVFVTKSHFGEHHPSPKALVSFKSM